MDAVETKIRKMFGAVVGKNQVGVTPDSGMRNQNGLDKIDLEAAQQGQSVRILATMRPRKRKVYCRTR